MLKEKFERVKEFVKDHKEEIRDIAVYATISGVSMLIGYRINGSRSRKVIADKEGLVLTDEELDARLAENAEAAGIGVETLLANGVTKDNYRESYLYEDVLNFLVENAVNTMSE